MDEGAGRGPPARAGLSRPGRPTGLSTSHQDMQRTSGPGRSSISGNPYVVDLDRLNSRVFGVNQDQPLNSPGTPKPGHVSITRANDPKGDELKRERRDRFFQGRSLERGQLVQETPNNNNQSSAPRSSHSSHPAGSSSALASGKKDIDPRDGDLYLDPLDPDVVKLHRADRQESVFNETRRVKPLTLTFKDIRFDVVTKKHKGPDESRQIIKGLSGQVEPASLLSIIGSSGAGGRSLVGPTSGLPTKTLDSWFDEILAGRLDARGKGDTSGEVLVNGHKRDVSEFRRISAYVLQEDVFFAELTVRETIMLSANLRLPGKMSREDKKERVDMVIRELGLKKAENTIIGSETRRGVSGGEKKRVNIGTELVTNPTLVFCDEPTTGLDSFNAQNVMDSLLTLAKAGRTVIATIHQPRSEIYNMLDQLMLLSEGNMLYMGSAKEAVPYFDRLGYPSPKSYNPADWFLDLISLDARSAELESRTSKRIAYLADAFRKHQRSLPHNQQSSGQHDASVGLAQHHPASASDAELGVSSKPTRSGYAVSWCTQFGLLLRRAARIAMRENQVNMAKMVQTIFFAILLGIIWFMEGGGDGGRSVQTVAGALFFALINQSFGGTFGIIYVFPLEKAIIQKERASRSYQVGAYFGSKVIVEIPRILLPLLLFSVVVYFMIDFRPDAGAFFGFLFVLFLATEAASGIAYIVSALSSTAQEAGSIAPIFMVTSILFGGFFINFEQVPNWISWLRYLSYIKYSFAALLQLEYEDRSLDTSSCSGSAAEAGQLCFSEGSQVLEFYDVADIDFGYNILILIAMTVGFHFIAYLILLYRGPKFDTSV
ncbi:uncharacterized protein MONBRDRAFT_23998 [Monosiga brevicollis MX1]|uniref:ABC transporter domain-containing protein n=1 Tax=Monosiga brevicollis TaxID=81824 RepID=A9UUE4_MONBE|nr:uncharacterized protein MONBRDRAFT_23998 [Monosiga brevicollis MX1]EDQ91083.1 predicted protein [Monosiga brevicollis MX1]|eukprot:XP_001744380.1 hypothetical protein [Monosiga brevicollis MX1]